MTRDRYHERDAAICRRYIAAFGLRPIDPLPERDVGVIAELDADVAT